jgi:hypothetical protein
MAESRLELQYYRAGIDYYIAGRFSARCRLTPTAGNQFHHAIEFFLKGYLTRSHTEQQRRQLGHHLPTIWAEFRGQVPDPSFDHFNDTITDLQLFEGIRYVDRLLREGASTLFDYSPHGIPRANRRNSSSGPASGPGAVPAYNLYVADLDELTAALLRQGGVNLPGVLPNMDNTAHEFLVVDNSFIASDPPHYV